MFQDFVIYDIELRVSDNGNISRHKLQLPRMIIEQQFLGLADQAARIQRPVKVELIRTEPYYDQYEQKYIPQEYKVIFANNTYVSNHSEEFKE